MSDDLDERDEHGDLTDWALACAALASVLSGSAALAPGTTAPRVAPQRPAHSQPASQQATRLRPVPQDRFDHAPPTSQPSLEQRAYRATQRGPYALTIAAAADRWKHDPFVLDRLLWVESRHQSGRVNRRTGAAGIAQFTRSGAAAVGRLQRQRGVRRTFTYRQALDPELAIWAAAELLAHLVDHCQGSLARAIGAYNTGRCMVNDFARRVMRMAEWLRMQEEPRT